MKGRKKNRAEKYDPREDLLRQWVKAYAGKFADHAGWAVAMEYCQHHYGDAATKKKNEEHWKSFPPCEPKKALLAWCEIILGSPDPLQVANGLAELADAIKAADDLTRNKRKAIDEKRVALIGANNRLHEVLAKKKKFSEKVKKNDLVKLVQESAFFIDVDQPGILRMMRELGLPKWPTHLRPEWRTHVKSVLPPRPSSQKTGK